MTAKKILEAFLELLLPRPENVKILESMNPETFRKRVASAHSGLHPLSPNTLFLFDYGHSLIRQAVWELKYRGNKKIGRLLSECLYEELVEEITERKALKNFDRPILVPIPLSKKRERERGFNQCELLAEALEVLDGENLFEVRRDILVKTKNTESQTKKNRTARLKNLEGCFSVKYPEEISGRNIILLDDVITTGATLDEARRTLKRAGAGSILSIALAH